MAFNVKKNKRLPALAENSETTGENETNATENGQHEVSTWNTNGKNFVATHGWVYGILRKLWNWTKFFATESMQVAGGIHAGRVSTCELQTNDIYATKLYLVDKNGRAMAIYIDDSGDIKYDYDYQDVFVYPGSGEVDIRNFVYRYGKDPYSIPPDDNVARNFVGLTPYELLMNFVPFISNGQTELDDKTCYRLCAADGEDELVRRTMLFTCPANKKITEVRSFDRDGGLKQVYQVPLDRQYRRMTVNMPTFVDEQGEKHYVQLPGDFPAIGGDAFRPFFPPFLRPPKPHGFFPPPPPWMPPGKYPDFPNNDIFNDEINPIPEDDFFQDLTKPDVDVVPNTPFDIKKNYTISYEDYELTTYFNIALKRSQFDKNKEQFFMVKIEDVA